MPGHRDNCSFGPVRIQKTLLDGWNAIYHQNWNEKRVFDRVRKNYFWCFGRLLFEKGLMMNDEISLLSKLKRKVGSWEPFINFSIKITKNKLRILTYHGISPLGVDPIEFEKQLKYISSHFECYWVSEIPKLLTNKKSKKPSLIITFDDGFKNHFIKAMPLLEKYNIKATFYIPIDLAENQSFLWNHEIRCLLMMIEEGDLPKEIGIIKDKQKKYFEIGRYIESLKKLNINERSSIQNDLRKKLKNANFSDWMMNEYQLMTVEDVRKVSDLIEIGSHTLTHPILTTISDELLVKEIQESRYKLEKITGKQILSFCYPNGIYSDKVLNVVEKNYPVAVSTREGFVYSSDNLMTLKRIPAGKNMEDFLLRLIRPTA